MSTVTGSVTNGITIGENGYTSPLTVAAGGTVDAASGDAVYSASRAVVVDRGAIEATAAGSDGIALRKAASVGNSGLIEGLASGVYISGGAGTVSNSATIEATGTTGVSVGVFLGSGGSVGNSGAASLIEGALFGISMSGAVGKVTNAGTIESTGTGSDGISLQHGGSVSNSGTVTGPGDGVAIGVGAGTVVNHGFIAGAVYGVLLTAAAGNVANDGTIENTGTSGAAIRMIDGGTLDNQGLLSGTVGIFLDVGALIMNGTDGSAAGTITAATGIVMNGAGGSIVNFGTVGATIGASGYATGISAAAGDEVTNFGMVTAAGTKGVGVSLVRGDIVNKPAGGSTALISAGHYAVSLGNGTVTNSGTIAGGVDAVISRGSAVAVGNSGLIEGTGTNSDGIYLFQGSISNQPGGTISGGVGGIEIINGPGTVVNAGMIAGTIGSGILLGDGGTVINTGLVEGATGITTGSANTTIVNGGTVESTGTGTDAISLGGGGTDLLVVDPGAVFVGAVVGPGASGTLELADGDTGSLSGLGTSFQSFGTIKVDPKATWTLSGDASASFVDNDGKILVTQALDFGAIGEDAGQHGAIDVVNAGTAEFEAAVGSAQSLAFTGTGGLVQLEDPAAGFAATISGFKKGDVIELLNATANGHTFSKGQLSVTENGTTVRTLTFKGHYTTSEFTVTQVGSNVEITIGTPEGAAPVFVHAGPGGGGSRGAIETLAGGNGHIDGFMPSGGAAAGSATGVAGDGSLVSSAGDPFHFWTIPG